MKSAAALMKRFRSVARIREASEAELAEVVGAARARRVWLHFHDGEPAAAVPDTEAEAEAPEESVE